MTDAEILTSLQNNRYTAAVNGLYRVLPAVKKYIKANNGTADDASDIFQDALVILYKKVQAGGFTLTVPLQTYLLAVVKNCWMQELRRRKKMPATASFPEEIPDTTAQDETAWWQAKAAFGLLGKKCRQLLLLFYYHRKSFKEIATTLSFSDERVAKNQKYRCMEKAKEHYLILSNTATDEQ